MYLECNAKEISAKSFLGKKLGFHTEVCDYFQYLIFKYSIFHRFIRSRSCPNQTKLGMEYPMCTLSVLQKELLL